MAVRSLHTVREDQYQHVWDNSVPPVLTVRPNEPVTLQTRDAGNDLIKPGDGVNAVNLYFSRVNPITGPIAIEGARPGDVLQVDVLAIETQPWGWTASFFVPNTLFDA